MNGTDAAPAVFDPMSVDIAALVRTIPDFPKPGILFRDITTLMADGPGFRSVVERLAVMSRPLNPDVIAGIEARGFIIGAALAMLLGVGFVPIRKPGKLPGKKVGIDYVLEYGSDRLELHEGQVSEGSRVILVDDLIATGGTARAAAQLLQEQRAELLAALFVIDLPTLGGANALRGDGLSVTSLMAFDGH